MAADENGEKTEQATPKKRQEARDKGNVAKSTDLVAAGVMLCAAGLLMIEGPKLVLALGRYLATSLQEPAWQTMTRDLMYQQNGAGIQFLLTTLLPFLLIMFGAGVIFNVIQVGFLLTTEPLAPQLSRIDPMSGFGRIFSMRAVAKLGVSLLKLIALGTLATWFVHSSLAEFANLETRTVTGIAHAIGGSLVQLAFILAGTLFALALLDFAFQKWKHAEDLKMTKQEVKDELKQMDGDPLIKQRRRELHAQMTAARNMGQVKDADFVLANPTHFAIAFQYDVKKMAAPTVVAKGVDEVALQIRRTAIEHGVPIIERPELTRSIYPQLKAGRPIPTEMYEVFVELLAYVYRITGRKPPEIQPPQKSA